ncbi:DUF5677 domain-containing protein [Microbacterium maritypicum]
MAMSEEQTRSLIAELQSEWDAVSEVRAFRQPKSRRGQRFTGADAARITAIIGLSRHVHDTSPAIMLLLEHGHISAAVPLVRLVFECSLTAAWLVQSTDDHGIRAFLHSYSRSRSSLQKDAMEATTRVFRDGAPEITDTDPTPFGGSYDDAHRFGEICLDLKPAGKDAYIYYRVLSGLSHASPRVADLYFAPDSPDAGIPAFRPTPDQSFPTDVLAFFTAASMVWSARAYSYLITNTQYRNFLRRSARQLEINDELQLSERYWERHAKNEAKRRAEKSVNDD